ncbi:hypothetical protein AXX12_18245 [Anaerosporomusa subterranea]|uniref:EamA domain-containing protein n=1 Tax=Anaerosporomusa subterranea TaxID=1794912 RepID=A0A154BUG7_ANASB|nr:hypothetical protein [Anaerosporomusa subterranea]KYZ77673.1 hypothetical protein AXX12_18245 [Anaerosporomusa subterranea]
MLFYWPIVLTVVSNVCYHIFLKLTPANANPLLSLSAAYATAMVATLAMYPFYANGNGIRQGFGELNWTSYALGLAIVGLEVGFLLAYRLGWQISLVGMISNSAVALLLIPIGLFFFQDSLTPTNMLGVVFCFIGLLLVNWKA